MDKSLYLDEKKLCKSCSHKRLDHKYNIDEQNNDLKCRISGCGCVNFVEWD